MIQLLKISYKGISYKGFTLMEMLASITIFFLMMTTILWVYRQMVFIKTDTTAKQHLIQQSYLFMERINNMIKDKGIDYEEYFNRKLVWCNSTAIEWLWDTATWWMCQRFTSYGNYHSLNNTLSDNNNTSTHLLYHCSSLLLLDQNLWSYSSIVFGNAGTTNLRDGKWCYTDDSSRFNITMRQSYGQYKLQHTDVWLQTDAQRNTSVWDDDDIQLWIWPIAIWNSNNVQELYLISADQQERLYLRRRLVRSGDRDGDWIIGNTSTDNLYTIEILKLKWFDAWNNHSFDVNSTGVYDWITDTRACDYNEWFICQWTSIWWIYSWYRLPIDEYDWWLSITPHSITISDWSLFLTPNRNPQYAWGINEVQINPFIRIQFSTHLYGEFWHMSIRPSSLNAYTLTLQSAFTTKQQYIE